MAANPACRRPPQVVIAFPLLPGYASLLLVVRKSVADSEASTIALGRLSDDAVCRCHAFAHSLATNGHIVTGAGISPYKAMELSRVYLDRDKPKA